MPTWGGACQPIEPPAINRESDRVGRRGARDHRLGHLPPSWNAQDAALGIWVNASAENEFGGPETGARSGLGDQGLGAEETVFRVLVRLSDRKAE